MAAPWPYVSPCVWGAWVRLKPGQERVCDEDYLSRVQVEVASLVSTPIARVKDSSTRQLDRGSRAQGGNEGHFNYSLVANASPLANDEGPFANESCGRALSNAAFAAVSCNMVVPLVPSRV